MSAPRLGDFFVNRQESGRDGLPVMSVTMNDSLVLRDDLDRRMESALRADQHLLIRKGDIAYNMMRMWQGACGLAEADGIVSPAYVVLQPKPNINSQFAYHWFKSARMIHLFWAYSHGLTEDRLRLYYDSFAEIPAAPPALERQEGIVAALDAWDQAIDQMKRLIISKRRRKIALLSSIFGAQRNPLKTRGVPLGEVASIHYGKGLALGDYVENGLSPVLGTQGEIGRTDRRLFDGPAIIVGRKGTLDRPHFIDESRPFWAIDTTFVVRPAVNARLLHAFLDYVDLTRLNEASGVPSLSSENLGALLVPQQPFTQAEKIESLIKAMDKDISCTTEELSSVSKQKRGLVQKLLTGEGQLGERFDSQSSAPLLAPLGTMA